MLRPHSGSIALRLAAGLACTILMAASADAADSAVGDSVAGAKAFTRNCTMCHGQDGRAQTSVARKLGVRDLGGSTLSEAEIRQTIVEGRRNERGTQTMPAFAGKIGDADLDALVAYVKGLRKPPAGD